MYEPRASTIAEAVRRALRATGITERAYADDVAQIYQQRTALHERSVEFHGYTTADTYEAASRANAQLLRRMLSGEHRLPVDLEEACVLALPQPHQRQLLAALCQRYGLLAVPMPASGGTAQHTQLADLMRDVSEAIDRVVPMLADGRIDRADRVMAPAALAELRDVAASATALAASIRVATGIAEPA